MAFFRSSTLIGRARPTTRLTTNTTLRAPFSTRSSLLANQSYGGGDGDPKGENPQNQGTTAKSSDLEHPGPPPPDAGKGTGGGPTKAGSEGHHEGGESSGKPSNSSSGSNSNNGSSPKIHNPSQHADADKSDEVRKHNEDFEKRHDRSGNQAGDHEKVDSKFWSGKDSGTGAKSK